MKILYWNTHTQPDWNENILAVLLAAIGCYVVAVWGSGLGADNPSQFRRWEWLGPSVGYWVFLSKPFRLGRFVPRARLWCCVIGGLSHHGRLVGCKTYARDSTRPRRIYRTRVKKTYYSIRTSLIHRIKQPFSASAQRERSAMVFRCVGNFEINRVLAMRMGGLEDLAT